MLLRNDVKYMARKKIYWCMGITVGWLAVDIKVYLTSGLIFFKDGLEKQVTGRWD